MENKKIVPIFIAVVTLLFIGAVGEQLHSLFQKLTSFGKIKKTAQNNSTELAPQQTI